MGIRRPFVLVILDGFGYADKKKYNAVTHANIPHITQWLKKYPHAFLKASGPAVGLPAGYIGNSEVGHLTIGAGRIIEQPLTLINKALENGSFFSNPVLREKLTQLAGNSAKNNMGDSARDTGNKSHALHIMGLLSDAGVHSHEKHLYGYIKAALECGVQNIVIHAFLDGRDVAPRSAEIYLNRLENYLGVLRAEHGSAHIILGSVMGRFYALDRDNNWDRTCCAYQALTNNSQSENNKAQSRKWQDVLAQQYARSVTDEYIEPTRLDPAGVIKPGDGVIFFNFRPDRARQLTRAFINPECAGPKLSFFITPVSYFYNTSHNPNPITVLFPQEPIPNTLKEVISHAGLKIFSIAETEKYAHVTYFLGGYHEAPFPGETQQIVPSLHVPSYAQSPTMSAQEITQTVLASLTTDPRDFYVINYANADMVGHSGDFQATVKAVACLDVQLAKLYTEIVEKKNGVLWITADHGKAEDMFDEKTGQPRTAHTANLVPFIEISRSKHKSSQQAQAASDHAHVCAQTSSCTRSDNGASETHAQLPMHGLADVAPHILSVMGIPVPEEMTKK